MLPKDQPYKNSIEVYLIFLFVYTMVVKNMKYNKPPTISNNNTNIELILYLISYYFLLACIINTKGTWEFNIYIGSDRSLIRFSHNTTLITQKKGLQCKVGGWGQKICGHCSQLIVWGRCGSAPRDRCDVCPSQLLSLSL